MCIRDRPEGSVISGIMKDNGKDVVVLWDGAAGSLDGIVDAHSTFKDGSDKGNMKDALKAVGKGNVKPIKTHSASGQGDYSAAVNSIENLAMNSFGGYCAPQPVYVEVAPLVPPEQPRGPAMEQEAELEEVKTSKGADDEKPAPSNVYFELGLAKGNITNTYTVDGENSDSDFAFDTSATVFEAGYESPSLRGKLQFSQTSGTESAPWDPYYQVGMKANTQYFTGDWRVFHIGPVGFTLGIAGQHTSVDFGEFDYGYYPIIYQSDDNIMAEARAGILVSDKDGRAGSHLLFEAGLGWQEIANVAPEWMGNDVNQHGESTKVEQPFFSISGQKIFKDDYGRPSTTLRGEARYGEMENAFHIGANEWLRDSEAGHLKLGLEKVLGNWGNGSQFYIDLSAKYNFDRSTYDRWQELPDGTKEHKFGESMTAMPTGAIFFGLRF